MTASSDRREAHAPGIVTVGAGPTIDVTLGVGPTIDDIAHAPGIVMVRAGPTIDVKLGASPTIDAIAHAPGIVIVDAGSTPQRTHPSSSSSWWAQAHHPRLAVPTSAIRFRDNALNVYTFRQTSVP